MTKKRRKISEIYSDMDKVNKRGSKSNRLKSKKELVKELDDSHYSKDEISSLRCGIEMEFAMKCFHKDTGEGYKCTCPDVMSWDDEKVLVYLGLENGRLENED